MEDIVYYRVEALELSSILSDLNFGNLVLRKLSVSDSDSYIKNVLTNIVRGYPVGYYICVRTRDGMFSFVERDYKENINGSYNLVINGSDFLSVIFDVFYGDKECYLYLDDFDIDFFCNNKPYFRVKSLFETVEYLSEAKRIKEEYSDEYVKKISSLNRIANYIILSYVVDGDRITDKQILDMIG